MAYFLQQVVPGNMTSPIIIPLKGDEVLIGAKNVAWKFPKLSERHAMFYKSEDILSENQKINLFIKDLGSPYGVYVNYARIGSTLKPINITDIIGFGAKTAEDGFVCVLCWEEKLEDRKNIRKSIRNQPTVLNSHPEQHVKIKIEYIEIVDDDEEGLPKIKKDSIKSVNAPYPGIKTFNMKESTARSLNISNAGNLSVEDNASFERTQSSSSSRDKVKLVRKRYPKLKECEVCLIKCDSEDFPWPTDVRNPFIVHSEEDEDILRSSKKRPRILSSSSSAESSDSSAESSDSSAESSDSLAENSESSANSFMEKTKNKQSQFSYLKRASAIDSDSSVEKFEDFSQSSTSCVLKKSHAGKNLIRHPKKRARKISDSSVKASDDFCGSTSYVNQTSFPDQPKQENFSSNNYKVQPKLSSDSSIENLDKKVHLNNNTISQNSFLDFSFSDSFRKSSNKNVHLNKRNPIKSSGALPDSTSSVSSVGNLNKNVQLNKNCLLKSTEVLPDSTSSISSIKNFNKNVHLNKNYPLKNSVILLDLSSSDSSVENLNRNVHLNESNPLKGSETLLDLASSNSSLENLSRNTSLNPPKGFNIETTVSSSSSNYQSNIQKKELKPKAFQDFSNNNINIRDTNHLLLRDRHHDSLNETDTYSQVDKIIVISDNDDCFLKQMQNFDHVKTEPEVVDDFEYGENFKLIQFEGNYELENPRFNVTSKNSVYENQEGDSIERIEEFANCSARRDPSESKSGGSEEMNSNLTDSVSEIPAEDSYLPSVKDITLKNTKLDTKGNSKRSGIMLTDPKPLTYTPRYKRGRDEGYVERQKKPVDLLPKRKRGRPKKQNQLPERKNTRDESMIESFHSSQSNNTKSVGKTFLTDSKTMQNRPSQDKGRGNVSAERQIISDLFAKRKRGRPKKSSVEQEIRFANYPDLQMQLSKKPDKSNEKNTANNYYKNKNLPSSKNTENPSKVTSSVKIRPEKFSSRMGFLTVEEGIKPLRRDKISAERKTHNVIPNAEKSDAQHFGRSNVKTADLKQNKVSEQIVSRCVTPVNHIEKIPKQNRSSSSNSFQIRNLQDNNSQSTSHTFAEPSKRLVMPREDIELSYDLTLHGMVKSLTQFQTIWLQEQLKIHHPPDPVTEGIATLPLSFESYKRYASSFYRLILLEIWQCMFEESKSLLNSKKMCNRFTFRVLSYSHNDGCIDLNCESIVNEKYSFEPREGTITILEMKINASESYPLFGFITNHKIDSLNLKLLHPAWKRTTVEYFKDAKRWTFHALIREKDLVLEPSILMKGKGICYIRSSLRLVDALRRFRDSPLLSDIIKPKLSTCAVKCFSESSRNREYTYDQMGIIRAISAEIYKPYLNCKIILLNGPSGTGKTHSVIGILETLFFISKGVSNLKILVTAPSNVAVDEIGCRLIELNERYGWRDHTVKFVRIGVEKQVHSKMLPYFIDWKAADLLKKLSRQKEDELQELHLKISNLEREPDSPNKKNMLNILMQKQKNIEDQISSKTANHLIDYKLDILKESHIVLSTLSSCSLSVLLKSFQPNFDMNFSCCIVDESTQCNELEILQPLALGISKLVLVGDEKQLPATNSVYSKKYGFHRSMYERFCSYFRSIQQASPALTLTEQFRMDPSICQFPLAYIYDKKLDTHPDKALRYKDFPLRPYFILDIDQSSSSLRNINNCEVLVYNICKCLAKVIDSSSSIGIIVNLNGPHESRPLHKKSRSQFRNVEVNTVNGFQGREKDIVILCAFQTVPPSVAESFISCKRRFNVALTRAKKCLIICLHSESLMEYPHWKALICNAQERKTCFTVTCPKDFFDVMTLCTQKKK